MNRTRSDSDGKSVLPIRKLPDQEHVQEGNSVDVSPSEEQAQELWDPPVGHLEEEQQSTVTTRGLPETWMKLGELIIRKWKSI